MSFAFVERRGVELLVSDSLPGLTAAFTTCNGGVSEGPYQSLNLGLHVDDDPAAAVENRRRACAALGLVATDLVVAVQSHGPNVAVVDASFSGQGATSLDDAVANADALVTTTPGLPLLIMVADCVPIICWDPTNRVLGVVHAGWRGAVTRVTQAAIESMTELGAAPDQIVAAIGPAIHPDRYQVGPEVAEQAIDGLGPAIAEQVIRPDGAGRFLFDLWASNEAVLIESGLVPSNITTARIDSGDARFFSDRLARPCGRFAAIAAIPPNR